MTTPKNPPKYSPNKHPGRIFYFTLVILAIIAFSIGILYLSGYLSHNPFMSNEPESGIAGEINLNQTATDFTDSSPLESSPGNLRPQECPVTKPYVMGTVQEVSLDNGRVCLAVQLEAAKSYYFLTDGNYEIDFRLLAGNGEKLAESIISYVPSLVATINTTGEYYLLITCHSDRYGVVIMLQSHEGTTAP